MAIHIGDVYRATARWILANQICNTVWHFRGLAHLTGAQPDVALNALADQIETQLENIAAGQHESVNYEHLSITFQVGNGEPHFLLRDLDIDGEATGEALPGLVALPFFLATGFAGRRFNGRFHWGGLTEALQDDGRLTTAGETLADAIGSTLLTFGNAALGGGVFRWCVFSRTEYAEQVAGGGVPPAGDTNWATWIARNINGVAHGSILGSMYSRKIGRGQ